MIRLAAFDLDNTLAKPGRSIAAEDVALLRELESRGVSVAVCSGKPAEYLCGLMRQVGLARPILIGENGAVIQIGVELPPRSFCVLPYSEEAAAGIRFLREQILKRLPGIWFQNNIVGLTPFPADGREFEIVEACIRACRRQLRDVEIYRHADAIDIVPRGIDKMAGMRFLEKLTGIGPHETAAVGDSVNDYPMFEYAALAIGVNVKDADRVDINFSSPGEALKYLLENHGL